MKKHLLLSLALSALLVACDNSSRKTENDQEPAATTQTQDSLQVAEQPVDSMAAKEAEVSKLQSYLRNSLLKEDLKDMTTEQRKFQYTTVDLNDDGSMEYLIGFQSSYFCGSGGCTYLLIDQGGKVLGDFSVSGGPFIVSDSKTSGYRDLLVSHNGKMHNLQFSGSTYPGNPSTAPLYSGTPATDLIRLMPDNSGLAVYTF